jgi:hypothetical protein
LLGRTEEAAQTYAKFVAKAELKSPERALDVLKEIASKLTGARGKPRPAGRGRIAQTGKPSCIFSLEFSAARYIGARC